MPLETARRDLEGRPKKMIYVGIDLHRKRSQIAALDEQGNELLSRRVANEPEALKAILSELGDELQVALDVGPSNVVPERVESCARCLAAEAAVGSAVIVEVEP